MMVEIGSAAPRDLSGAFFAAVKGEDLLAASVKSLEDMAEEIDRAYGPACDRHCIMALPRKEGTLAEVAAFAA